MAREGINWCKLLLRFAQFIVCAAAIAFAAAFQQSAPEASTTSKIASLPFSGENSASTVVNFYAFYVIAALGCLVALGITFFTCSSRYQNGGKGWGVTIFLLDLAMAIALGVVTSYLASKYQCTANEGAWCGYYITALFFGEFACVLFIISLLWDILVKCCPSCCCCCREG